MSDVFYLRPLEPPITRESVDDMAQHAGGCFDLHRVEWHHSFLATGGDRMLCWYRAPDTESVRAALRQLEADLGGVWAGQVLPPADPSSTELDKVNLVVEVASEQALEPKAAHAAARP